MITAQQFLDKCVDKRYNFLAKQSDSTIYIFLKRPKFDALNQYWIVGENDMRPEAHVCVRGVDVVWDSDDWKECIVEREIPFEELMGRIVVAGTGDIGYLQGYIGSDSVFPYIIDKLDGIRIFRDRVRPLTTEEKELLA